MIHLEHVSRVYATPAGPVRAVDGVTLDLEAGRLTCLLGASGSGKSTLLNLIAGIEVPDDGVVTVGETTVSALDEKARARFRLENIAVIFQDGNLIAEFRALENVELALIARGAAPAAARSTAQAALERVGIGDLTQRWPTEMSGGQRQRVGVARALAGNQPVILADEPTGSLDSVTSHGLFEQLAALAHDRNACVVVATHDPIGERFADRTLWLRDGQVVK